MPSAQIVRHGSRLIRGLNVVIATDVSIIYMMTNMKFIAVSNVPKEKRIVQNTKINFLCVGLAHVTKCAKISIINIV